MADLFTDPTQQGARLTQLDAAISDLARSMDFAQRTGQAEALAAFRVQFRALVGQAASLRAAMNGSDAPAALLVRMDALSDKIIALAKAIGQPVGDLLHSTSLLLKLLPWLVVAAVVGVLYWAAKGNLKVRV